MRPPPRVPYLTLLRSKGEAQTPSSTPRASSQSSSPYRRLLSSTVITSSTPAPYAPPLASSSPSRAPPRPRVPHRPLLPHRSSPSDRVHRRREPTQVSLPPCKSLNWVPPPLGPVPRQFLLRPRPSAGRISPASHRRRGGGGIPSPVSPGGPKQPRKLDRVGLGSVMEWAGLAGRSKARSSGAVQPWAASGPRGRICLNFIFQIIFGIS
jgi:hypothetical protein